jgi:AbiV family abortive infection protein
LRESSEKSQNNFLQVLFNGAEKTRENATKLNDEAKILSAAGAIARAVCLHQISMEECSKVEMLAAWIMSILSGVEVDQQKVISAMSKHSAKNKNNAYFLDKSEGEKKAIAEGDWKKASDEFDRMQAIHHQQSNDLKNSSLYVNWTGEKFVSPMECITSEDLSKIAQRNSEFVGIAVGFCRVLKRLVSDPGSSRSVAQNFVKAAERLRSEMPNDPEKAMSLLFDQLLAERKLSMTMKGEHV